MIAFLVKNKLLLLVIILILAAAFGIGAYLIGKASNPQNIVSSGVSGTFNLNGVVPQGSTITLLQREVSKSDPLIPFATGINPSDEGVWGFTQSVAGKSYEIQGLLVQNGKVIYRTSPIFVSAPAIDQLLVFNVPSTQAASATVGNSTISGQVGVNGYIPPGSTITLLGRKLGADQFEVVNEGLPAQDNQVVTFATALPGQTYEIQGLLYDANNTQIGSSSILIVAAPAYNEQLDINSIAVPPVTPTQVPTATPTSAPPTATPTQGPTSTPTATPTPSATPVPTPVPAISGSIQFNGQAQANTRIVIFQRVTGTQNYQVAVNNVPPVNGATWQWTGVQPGTMYDMIAVLKQAQPNGTDIDMADSTPITITAPAANEIFTINSGFYLSQPGTNITVSCSNYSSTNQTWTATISFGNMSNALSYWYQVGITNGGSELSNIAQNAGSNNSAPTLTVQFTNNMTYYARYAYGSNYGMAIGNAQFSPFSSTVPLSCSP